LGGCQDIRGEEGIGFSGKPMEFEEFL